jgi:hypothetical protein
MALREHLNLALDMKVVTSSERTATPALNPLKVPTAGRCLCPEGRGSVTRGVLHLRGNVSGWPRTRIGKGVCSDKERLERFELLRTRLRPGTCVNKPPVDAPDSSGWHHAHSVDALDKNARGQ